MCISDLESSKQRCSDDAVVDVRFSPHGVNVDMMWMWAWSEGCPHPHAVIHRNSKVIHRNRVAGVRRQGVVNASRMLRISRRR